ncbi:MAG: hypothetical protein K8R06_09720 [Methanosarcinales archaeon]|nr:hypothetical protein [Methanosarcinales archaeon]
MPLTYPNTNTCSENPATNPHAIAPFSPHTTRTGGAYQEGAPGQRGGERGRQQSRRIEGSWNQFYNNRRVR